MTNDAGGSGAPRFDVVLRGYDRRQVDEHVARLQRIVGRMRADLELARSQPLPIVTPLQQVGHHPVQGHAQPSHGPGTPPPPGRGRPSPSPSPRPRRPGDGPDVVGSFTDRMKTILQQAEDEAGEVRKKAHTAATAETRAARAEVAELNRQRDVMIGELSRLRGQLESMLSAPTTRMAAVLPKAPPRAAAPDTQVIAAQAPAPAPSPAAAAPTAAVPTTAPAAPSPAAGSPVDAVAEGPSAEMPASADRPAAPVEPQQPAAAPRTPTGPQPAAQQSAAQQPPGGSGSGGSTADAARSDVTRPDVNQAQPVPKGTRGEAATGSANGVTRATAPTGADPVPDAGSDGEQGALFQPAPRAGSAGRPPDVESTVKVSAVRSGGSDATVLAPVVRPQAPEAQKAVPATNENAERTHSPSRSG